METGKKVTIGRTYHFESAHRLPLLPETHKCHTLHGHNYEVLITISNHIDERGFVMDFAELDEEIQPILKAIDHKVLNDTQGLENPTAENIALWFLDKVPQSNVVRVYETSQCWAEATRD